MGVAEEAVVLFVGTGLWLGKEGRIYGFGTGGFVYDGCGSNTGNSASSSQTTLDRLRAR